jgi:hypothetical protein
MNEIFGHIKSIFAVHPGYIVVYRVILHIDENGSVIGN